MIWISLAMIKFTKGHENTYNSFATINDIPHFGKNEEEVPFLPEFEDARKELQRYFKNEMPRHRKMYVTKGKPKPTVDRLAFPVDGAYSTYRDKQVCLFLIDLYNEYKKQGVDEPRVLVSHNLLHPLILEFYPTQSLTTSLPDLLEFIPYFHAFWRVARKRADVSKIKIIAHKTTSPGFPMELFNGSPVKRKDVVYGFDESDTLPVRHMRSDFSSMKRDLMKLLPGIYSMQKDLSSSGIGPDNIVRAASKLAITNNVNGYRFNSIDNPKNVPEVYKYGHVLWGKDRDYITYDGSRIIKGTLDVEGYAKWLHKEGYNPSGLSPQRLRPINASSFITNVPLQIDARLFLQHIEQGPSGFLSDTAQVKEGYEQFLEATQGRPLTFITGDRTNSEMFITSNWNVIKNLIPPEHRAIMDVFMTHVKWTQHGPLIVQGCLSGIGWTTGLNVIVGLYEMAHTISVLTGFSIREFATLFLSCFTSHQPFFEIGPFIIKPFLPTDDMPLVIAGEIDDRSITSLISQADDRRMSYDINKSGFTTFGMRVDNQGVAIAATSFLSKLFYIESPGYFAKDCFSISQRLQLLEDQTLVDQLLKKHFGIGCDFYHLSGGQFLKDLSRFGISVDEAFNIYSPKDKLLLGQYASVDPVFSTQDVTDDTCRFIVKDFLDEIHLPKV